MGAITPGGIAPQLEAYRRAFYSMEPMMNAERRKLIAKAIIAVRDLEPLMNAVKEKIEDIRDAEQETFDNMPESFQDGERGQKVDAAINALEAAIEFFDQFDVSDIVSSLEDASS